MTILTQHAPGTFCWPELATTDQAAAKGFYASLFGWTSHDVPMGPDAGFYTILKKKDKDCAALYTLQQDPSTKGMPPHWGAYVAVASADEAAKKATDLGATVMVQPFDVMGTLGRMAVIRDPQGAVFSVWQAKDNIGVGILDEPGALCWTELLTSDTDQAGRFYTSLLGWKAVAMPMGPMTYNLFKRPDGANAAGMMTLPKEIPAPPHWLSYFQVENIQDTAAKVTSLKGKTLMPPTPVPNVGSFAVFQDPQGAVFGVLEAIS